MKKLRLDAIAFIIIISGLGLVNMLNRDKPAMSALENRMLKEKPELTANSVFNGDYFRSFEDYYSDTFINRDGIVKMSRNIKDTLSLNDPGVALVVTHENAEAINGESRQEADKQPEASPEPTPADPAQSAGPEESSLSAISPEQKAGSPSASPTPTPVPEKQFGENDTVGYYLIVDGKAVQLFKFNREGMDYYAQVLNEYRARLGDGVTLYSMIPPTASEFLKLKKYKDITDSQNDAMDYLYGKLDPGIVPVNVYDALNSHKDEYIYFRTDHHWTALGAYYGYCAFMDAMKLPPVPLDEYEAGQVDNYLGSSYTKTLNKDLEKNPDTIYFYKPFTNYEYTMYSNKVKKADIIDMKYAEGTGDKYLMFLSTGGATWSVIKTDVHNGKKILVIKDSFGNTLVPFLLPHYEEIYVVDARYYDKEIAGMNILDFISHYGIQDVLFLFYMEDVNWTKFMQGAENMMK